MSSAEAASRFNTAELLVELATMAIGNAFMSSFWPLSICTSSCLPDVLASCTNIDSAPARSKLKMPLTESNSAVAGVTRSSSISITGSPLPVCLVTFLLPAFNTERLRRRSQFMKHLKKQNDWLCQKEHYFPKCPNFRLAYRIPKASPANNCLKSSFFVSC